MCNPNNMFASELSAEQLLLAACAMIQKLSRTANEFKTLGPIQYSEIIPFLEEYYSQEFEGKDHTRGILLHHLRLRHDPPIFEGGSIRRRQESEEQLNEGTVENVG